MIRLLQQRVFCYARGMTDATFIPGWFQTSQPKAEPKQRPAPQPFRAPVFIMDAVTPLGGETVLSLLLKKMAENDLDQP